MTTDVVKPGIWKHHRGAHYWVIGVGVLHDTDRRIVAYTSSRAADERKVLLRDYDDFIAPVVWPDGETRPRFVWEEPR